MKPIYRFDQLFEKLPNGSYRERPKPVAPLDIYHRHDFVRSERTGRICVVYPAMTWGDMVRLGMAKIGSSCHEPGKPLLGGNWFYGTRINWSYGLQSPDDVGARWGDVMMQALDRIIDGQQQTPSGGTNGGTSETQTS